MWWLSIALAFDPAAQLARDVLPPPPEEFLLESEEEHSVVDMGHVVIVRMDTITRGGFDSTQLAKAVSAALRDRPTRYDAVMGFHGPEMPQIIDAGAFHVGLNTSEQWGTGVPARSTPLIDTHSMLWMNVPTSWERWEMLSEGLGDWVFCHELSHRWLARALFDDDGEVSDAMLGRQRAHWSYFLNTPNSPIEGNAWIDNGDGSFTTDLSATRRFSTLDLYLMGMAERQEVEPTFLIEDPVAPYTTRTSSPEHLRMETSTIMGTRRDITIDDIVDVLGPRSPEAELAPRDLSVLTLYIVGPTEIVDLVEVERVATLQASWEQAWFEMTGERSTVSFAFDEPLFQPPPMPAEPSLIPEVAR